MKIVDTLRAFVAVCAFAAAQASAAPTLLVDSNGILTGAHNVNVNGALYNVTFTDGSCDSVFNACSTSSFAFMTQETALVAAQALLDQVFVDGNDGNFDTAPGLTSGCSAGSSYCIAYIPYSQDSWAYVENFNDFFTGDNIGGEASFSASYDLSNQVLATWAVFTITSPSASDVPEPGSIALMGVALAGLAFARRRKV